MKAEKLEILGPSQKYSQVFLSKLKLMLTYNPYEWPLWQRLIGVASLER